MPLTICLALFPLRQRIRCDVSILKILCSAFTFPLQQALYVPLRRKGSQAEDGGISFGICIKHQGRKHLQKRPL